MHTMLPQKPFLRDRTEAATNQILGEVCRIQVLKGQEDFPKERCSARWKEEGVTGVSGIGSTLLRPQ